MVRFQQAAISKILYPVKKSNYSLMVHEKDEVLYDGYFHKEIDSENPPNGNTVKQATKQSQRHSETTFPFAEITSCG